MSIPRSLIKQLEQDEFMRACCYKNCNRQLPEFHHIFIYSGRQIQEVFNIVPACKKHHDQATPHKPNYKQEVREYFEQVAMKRMTFDDYYKYPKRNWDQHAQYLNIKSKQYGWE